MCTRYSLCPGGGGGGGGVREREKEAKIETFSRCTEMYGLFLSSGVMEAVFISCMHAL